MTMHYFKKGLPVYFLLIFMSSFSQNGGNSFKPGEFLKYKIHYGLLNAGFATVELNEKLEQKNNRGHSVPAAVCARGLVRSNRLARLCNVAPSANSHITLQTQNFLIPSVVVGSA